MKCSCDQFRSLLHCLIHLKIARKHASRYQDLSPDERSLHRRVSHTADTPLSADEPNTREPSSTGSSLTASQYYKMDHHKYIQIMHIIQESHRYAEHVASHVPNSGQSAYVLPYTTSDETDGPD